MPHRTLSEPEFNAIEARIISSAPKGLKDEADFNRWVEPAIAQAVGEAENLPPEHEGSAMGRFLGGAASVLNPIEAVKGLWNAAPIPQALGGSGVIEGPTQAAKGIVGAMGDQWSQAAQAAKEGHYSEAAGHAAAGTIPIVGPMAAHAGERLGSGDIAGGLGESAGLLAPFGVKPAMKVAGKTAVAIGRTAPGAALASGLEAGAARRYVDVMAPKIGANKTRFGGMAEKVAPALAKDAEMGAWSREGLHAKTAVKLAQAEDALDAASDARLSARTFETQPMIDALLEQRKELEAQAVQGSKIGHQGRMLINEETGEIKPVTTGVTPGGAIGTNVVPAPNMARVGVIDQAIDELKALGPVTRYDEIRKIRQAYDGPAKAIYSPAMTTDFLKAQGGKLGAADVTGTLREQLAQWDPQTAVANADYSFQRKVNDVLDATAEVERTRPAVGRHIMTRLTTTLSGGQLAGPAGAGIGFVLAPFVEGAMSSGVTIKLQTAQLMSRLAKAIRGGDLAEVANISQAIRDVTPPPQPPPRGPTGRLGGPGTPPPSPTGPAGAPPSSRAALRIGASEPSGRPNPNMGGGGPMSPASPESVTAPTATYSYTGPEGPRFKVEGGPFHRSDVAAEQLRELGIPIPETPPPPAVKLNGDQLRAQALAIGRTPGNGKQRPPVVPAARPVTETHFSELMNKFGGKQP